MAHCLTITSWRHTPLRPNAIGDVEELIYDTLLCELSACRFYNELLVHIAETDESISSDRCELVTSLKTLRDE